MDNDEVLVAFSIEFDWTVSGFSFRQAGSNGGICDSCWQSIGIAPKLTTTYEHQSNKTVVV